MNRKSATVSLALASAVINPDGCVAARSIDPDFRKRWAIDEQLGALRQAGGST